MAADVPSLATSFTQEHAHVLTALASIVAAVLLAYLLDRALARRGRRLAAAVVRGDLSPVADTRLRFLRRLATLVILVMGFAVAISQFTGLSNVANSILASGALLAAILGFAARQTLANLIAGVMLAITQPLRIGDLVEIESQIGTVEDVRLNYTIVRGPDDRRVFIPNELLASGILQNYSIGTPTVALEVSVWIPPTADADAALTALEPVAGDGVVRIAEMTHEGIRLTVGNVMAAPTERAARSSELRAGALRALRSAGLLSPAAGG